MLQQVHLSERLDCLSNSLEMKPAFRAKGQLTPASSGVTHLSSGAITQRVADNCAADGVRDDHRPAISADVFRGGGFGVLIPETSRNYTFGGVWTPDLLT